MTEYSEEGQLITDEADAIQGAPRVFRTVYTMEGEAKIVPAGETTAAEGSPSPAESKPTGMASLGLGGVLLICAGIILVFVSWPIGLCLGLIGFWLIARRQDA